MGRDDVIPLWFGESDLPTPKFICDAAARALAAGDTFYQPNAGIAELRSSARRLHEPAVRHAAHAAQRDRLGIRP